MSSSQNSDLISNLKPKVFSFYLRLLSGLYFLGFALHLLDVLNLRLSFTDMDMIWKIWILYLLVFDLIASVGLWLQKKWGKYAFLFIAATQLVAYSIFKEQFGDQNILIYFHILTLILFFLLRPKTFSLNSVPIP